MEPEQADVPEILRKPNGSRAQDEPEVGAFRPGSPLSQLALARYLVGRAIAESVGSALLLLALAFLALAALSEWGAHSTVLAVFVVLIAAGVLVLRWLALLIVRRLTGFHRFGPVEERMSALVSDTRADVLRELRRIGLPGRTWTLPLLAFRLLSRARRPDTVARLRKFQTGRAVPKARVDELFLLLRRALRGGAPSGADWQTGRHD